MLGLQITEVGLCHFVHGRVLKADAAGLSGNLSEMRIPGMPSLKVLLLGGNNRQLGGTVPTCKVAKMPVFILPPPHLC